MKRPSLPLACTMLLCAFVFVGVATYMLTYAPIMLILSNVTERPQDQVVLLLPLLGAALLAMFASFTFVRILFRGSLGAARSFLAVAFFLSGMGVLVLFPDQLAQAVWVMGGMAFLALLFFWLKPAGRGQASGPVESR